MSLRAQYEKLNPFRSPGWRWERVLELVSHRPEPLRASRTEDDCYIRAYRKFLVRLQGRETRLSQMELFRETPALYFAHLFHHNPDKEHRSEIQARILAGQTDREIATKQYGTQTDVLRWYSKLFFDVRDRLGCSSYIRKVIIGRWDARQAASDGTITAYQWDMLLKIFGYYGGPHDLEFILESMKGQGRGYKAESSMDRMQENYLRNIVGAAAMHARTFPHNKYTVMQLFEITFKIIELQRRTQLGAGGAPKEYHRNAEALLKSIPWSIGSRGFKTKSRLELDYDESAVEPRADEQLQLASGVEPAELAAVKDLELRLVSEKT